MKQTFCTGDLPFQVVIENGQFTERDRKILSAEEIAEMQAHPDQTVFFRRYRSYSEKVK